MRFALSAHCTSVLLGLRREAGWKTWPKNGERGGHRRVGGREGEKFLSTSNGVETGTTPGWKGYKKLPFWQRLSLFSSARCGGGRSEVTHRQKLVFGFFYHGLRTLSSLSCIKKRDTSHMRDWFKFWNKNASTPCGFISEVCAINVI